MTKKRYKLLMAILINVFFLYIMTNFVGIYIELSDDWFFSKNIASGRYNYTFCSFFIQWLSGQLQKFIYPVSAFMLLQIIFSFVAFTTICYIFFDLYSFKKALVFSVFLESLFCVNFYSIITFSKTAAILVVAGGIVLLWTFHEKKNIGWSIYGILLVLLGSFYRLRIFYLVAAVFCCCIGGLILGRLKKPLGESIRAIIKDIFSPRFIVTGITILVLVLGCDFLSTKLILSSDPGVEYYKEYNHFRSRMVDYPLPEYEEYQEQYQELGISENDHKMLINWYFDDQGYADMETLAGIEELQKENQATSTEMILRIKKMIYSILVQIYHISSEGSVVIVFALFALTIVVLYKNKCLVYGITMCLGIGAMYVYLWTGGRVRFRVLLPIWLSAMTCLLYMYRFIECRDWAAELRKRLPKAVVALLTVAAIGTCGIIQYRTAIVTTEENRIENDYEYDDLFEFINAEQDKVFVLSHNAYNILRNRTVLRKPMSVGPDEIFDRCLYFGSPYYAHPSYNELLEKQGINNLYTDIVDNDKYYFVDRYNTEIVSFVKYLNEQYPQSVPYTCELIDVLNDHYIYKIRTGGVDQFVTLKQDLEDITVADGAVAEVKVDAVGKNLKYEWYFADANNEEFAYTDSFKGNSYRIDMTTEHDGRKVYCVITDPSGYSIRTNTVTLNIKKNE